MVPTEEWTDAQRQEDAQPGQYVSVAEEAPGRFVATPLGMPDVRCIGTSWGAAVDALRSRLGEPAIAERLRGKELSGRFSVRVPSSVHRALAALADAEGVSLNALVGTILAQKVGEGSSPRERELREETLIALLPGGPKGEPTADDVTTAVRVIHSVVEGMSLPSIGIALAILCADRVKHLGDPTRTADHYGKFAFLALNQGFTKLALSMWEESLRVKPGNPKSASSYGCLLYRLGRYPQAAAQLAGIADREGVLTYNKARLRLSIGNSEADEERKDALEKIRQEMRTWAFGANQRESSKWREHLADLQDIGTPEVGALTRELQEFAAKHSRWR